MFKNIKRLAACVLAAVICLSFTACHQKGEIAVKVSCDKLSEDLTSGFYACAFFNADAEAQQYLYDNLATEVISAENFDYRKQTIEGQKYADWVKARALEICKELFANKVACEQNNIDTAEYIVSADEWSDYSWDYSGYGEIMTENGVSFETYKKYQQYEYMREAYFNFLYGEGGQLEIPTADIEKSLVENYAYVNVLSTPVTDLSEDDLAAKKAEYDAYAVRIENGENFGKIYAEVNDTEYTVNEKDTGAFNNDLATVWDNEETADYFEHVKDMQSGEVKVTTIEDGGQKILVVLLRGNILDEANENLEDLKSQVRHDMKDEDFNAKMEEITAKVTLTEIKSATKPFKVKNIKYPESY